jgi:hypothetical protein
VHAALAVSRPDDFINQAVHGQALATSVVLGPRPGICGENAVSALLRHQQLQVSAGGLHLQVQVQPLYVPLRPHTHKMVISGLPGFYALEGISGVLLYCAGLVDSVAAGTNLVAGELLGEQLGRGATTSGGLPDASHLVAFVQAPDSDVGLKGMPRAFQIGEQTVRVRVIDLRDSGMDPPGEGAPMGRPADPATEDPGPQGPPATPRAAQPRQPATGSPMEVDTTPVAPQATPPPGQPPAPSAPSAPPVAATTPQLAAAVHASQGRRDPSPLGARSTADQARWWRRPTPETQESQGLPGRQPSTPSLPTILAGVQAAHSRQQSPTPRAGLGLPQVILPRQPGRAQPASRLTHGLSQDTPDQPHQPHLAQPLGRQTPGRSQGTPALPHPPCPTQSPGRLTPGLSQDEPDPATRGGQREHTPASSPAATQGPTAPAATHPQPPDPRQSAPAPPGRLATTTPPPLGAPATPPGPPPQPRMQPTVATPIQVGKGPQALTDHEAWLLRCCILAGPALDAWQPPLAPLMAGHHDALADYLATCPHQAAQMPAARILLRNLFVRHHPQLPSPEAEDPRPVVETFCRRALHQLDTTADGPLGEVQIDRLLTPSRRRDLPHKEPPSPLDQALLTAVERGMAPHTNAISGAPSTAAALLQLYRQHLVILAKHFGRVPASPDHATRFSRAAMAQVDARLGTTEGRGGRPVRRVGRGGQP